MQKIVLPRARASASGPGAQNAMGLRLAELLAMAILACALLIVPSMAGGGETLETAVAKGDPATPLDRLAHREVVAERKRQTR